MAPEFPEVLADPKNPSDLLGHLFPVDQPDPLNLVDPLRRSYPFDLYYPLTLVGLMVLLIPLGPPDRLDPLYRENLEDLNDREDLWDQLDPLYRFYLTYPSYLGDLRDLLHQMARGDQYRPSSQGGQADQLDPLRLLHPADP